MSASESWETPPLAALRSRAREGLPSEEEPQPARVRKAFAPDSALGEPQHRRLSRPEDDAAGGGGWETALASRSVLMPDDMHETGQRRKVPTTHLWDAEDASHLGTRNR